MKNQNIDVTKQPIKNAPKPWKTIFLSFGIVLVAFLIWTASESKSATAGFVVLFGVVSNAFAGLVALVGMIPFVGPLIIKVLSIPFFWMLNGLGYFVSAVAIKKGYTREVIGHRALTIVLLIGVVVGFILGRLIP